MKKLIVFFFLVIIAYSGWALFSWKQNLEEERLRSQQFAEGKSFIECVKEGIRRYKLCEKTDIMCTSSASVFTKTCSSQSIDIEEFCTSVAHLKKASISSRIKWSKEECKSRGIEADRVCRDQIREVEEYCRKIDS